MPFHTCTIFSILVQIAFIRKKKLFNGSAFISHHISQRVAQFPCSVSTNAIRNPQSARISVPPILLLSGEIWHWRTPLRSTAPYWTSKPGCTQLPLPLLRLHNQTGSRAYLATFLPHELRGCLSS